jgi:hypothetical protein
MRTTDRVLRERLYEWEAAALGDPLAAHHDRRLARYLAGLRTLAAEQDDRAQGVLLAALALGPRTGGLPGAGDIGTLLDSAATTDADVVDLVIAWGSGWHRTVSPDHGWHGRWVASLLSLSCLVEASISRSVRWLEASLPDLARALRAIGTAERRQLLTSFAHQVALELATSACRCGHGTRGSPSTPGSCSRPEHRLANWHPHTCRLTAFIATAVRGSARLPLRAGAFASSMLATLLLEDHLLRVDVAEFSVCHLCNHDLLRLASAQRRPLDISSVRIGLHDLTACPDCGAPSDPARTYRLARKHWLVVPADWGGQHDAAHRHRCAGCGNLFNSARHRCPICRRTISPRDRFTSVWVRVAGLDRKRHRTGLE